MAAPTFVSLTTIDFSTVFPGGGTKTSASISVLVGDVLVVMAQSEDRQNPDVTSISDTGTNTWTSQQHVTAGASVAGGRIYTTTIAAGHDGGGTITVTLGFTSAALQITSEHGGAGIYVYRGSGGIGNSTLSPASGSASAISTSLTASADNSAIVCGLGDWSATNQTTRTRATINSSTGTEAEYVFVSTIYTTMQLRWDDAGAAGSKTVGFATLSPGSSQLFIMAIEVLGTASGYDVPLLDPTQIRQFNVYRM